MKKKKMGRFLKKNYDGFTLVEMIVCFALIGLLMSAVVIVLASYTDTTIKNTSITQSETLACNLMDTISSELASALDDNTWGKNLTDELGTTDLKDAKTAVVRHKANDGKDKIFFMNSNGIMVCITTSDKKQLEIQYGDRTNGWDPSLNTSTQTTWEFGDSVYMNNEISKLSFSRFNGKVVKVELELTNQRTAYVTKKTSYIECYNLMENNVTEL